MDGKTRRWVYLHVFKPGQPALGLEPVPDSDEAQAYLTPLANISTSDIAFGARKLGGFTYQEFAAPIAQLKEFAPNGPDLSYDFFTRAEVLYGLISGDVLPLRLGHHFLLDQGVHAGTLIHDLQNADPTVAATRIDVDVDEGRATLRGTARTAEEAAIARDIASRVPGVKGVETEIELAEADTGSKSHG